MQRALPLQRSDLGAEQPWVAIDERLRLTNLDALSYQADDHVESLTLHTGRNHGDRCSGR